MRTIVYANGKSYGTVIGGIPVVVEKPNRKLRRLAARQAAQMEGDACTRPQGNANSKLVTTNKKDSTS